MGSAAGLTALALVFGWIFGSIFILWFLIRCITFINTGVDFHRMSIKKMRDEEIKKTFNKTASNVIPFNKKEVLKD
jgi:putative component of membrane protein insertase Oxa1/YidC/SpoIIIJ protein YidD